MSRKIDRDRVAFLAHKLACEAVDAGDALFLLKAVTAAIVVNVPGVLRGDEGRDEASASTLLTCSAVVAGELGVTRDNYLQAHADAFDHFVAKRDAIRRQHAS